MSIAAPQSYAIHQSFDDFDDLADQANNWNLELSQLDRGSFRGELLQFGIGNVHVGEAKFGRVLNQKGAPPDGLRTIAVPAVDDLKLTWRGEKIVGDELLVFPQGSELSGVSDPRFHMYTCTFPMELLASVFADIGVDQLDDQCRGAGVIHCDAMAMTSLRNLLRGLCDSAIVQATGPSDGSFFQRVLNELPRRLASAVATAHHSSSPKNARKRERALVRAEAFIEQTGGAGIKIKDICRAAQVSQRTLQYAFVERFGVTPQGFLKSFRLNSVRRQLRLADHFNESITDIANRFGFWHLGQFAADYRRLFGELPSETVDRFSDGRS